MALHAMPEVYVRRLGEDMRLFAEDDRMMFVDFDCNYQHWATNGLNYYVAAKLVEVLRADVDAIVDEYCTAGFGPAAPTVRRYFDELERITDAVAAGRRRPTPQDVARHYSDETLARLRGILDQAGHEAGDGVYRAASTSSARGWTTHRSPETISSPGRPACGATSGSGGSTRRRPCAGPTYFQKLGPSWAIHAPWLIYWDR